MLKVDDKLRFIKRSDWISGGREIRYEKLTPELHKHEGYEIVLVESGRCNIQIEHRSYALKKGDCLFIAEGEHHAVQVPQKCRLAYLDFRPELLFRQSELIDLFLRPFQKGLGGGSHLWTEGHELPGIVRNLIKAISSKSHSILNLLEHIFKLLRLFEKVSLCSKPDRLKHRVRIQPALDMIFKDYEKPLSVNKMAESCYLSRATFNRIFRNAMGKSPLVFLNEQRLNQAASLLLNTDKKIVEVALLSGFPNLSHFNRNFLKHFGKTPREARFLP